MQPLIAMEQHGKHIPDTTRKQLLKAIFSVLPVPRHEQQARTTQKVHLNLNGVSEKPELRVRG
jgi:hypothetical protein